MSPDVVLDVHRPQHQRALTALGSISRAEDDDVVAGPVRLWGAQGWGRGVYVRDPDGNTIELRTYEGDA